MGDAQLAITEMSLNLRGGFITHPFFLIAHKYSPQVRLGEICVSYKQVRSLIDSIADWFLELSGDRIQWEDKKLVTGLARIDDERALIIAFNPERTPHPEAALRKGIRMVRLAERMGCEVLLLLGAGSGRGWWPIGDHDFINALDGFMKALLAADVPIRIIKVGDVDEIENLIEELSSQHRPRSLPRE